jgi:MFS family permease
MGITGGIGLIGNCFGPLIGGGLTSGLGWRSIFWFLLIGGSIALLAIFLFYPETNRFVVKDGSIYPGWLNWSPFIYFRSRRTGIPSPKAPREAMPKRKVSILRGLRLLQWLDVWLMLIPSSLHYTTWFMIITAQSTLLSQNYGFDSSQIGLSYLASGIGSLSGSLMVGRLMNVWYRRQVEQFRKECMEQGREVHMSQFNIQKARLGLSAIPSGLQCVSGLIFGWTIQYKVNYVVPILMTFFVSWASVTFINTTNTLLVDLFPDDSASATAMVNLTRCLLASAGIAAVDKMIIAMTPGGAFTFMSFFSLSSLILIYIELRIGRKYDQKRRARLSASTPLPL